MSGGLRVRGRLAWLLWVLWVALGAAGAGYTFFLSTHLPAIPLYSRIPCWVGEPGVIIAAGELAAAAWLVLTIPVLATGLIRLRGWERRAGALACVWLAGIGLMVPVADWQTAAPVIYACAKGEGCVIGGYSRVVVSWGQLAICAAWLALGAAMTLILRRPPGGWDKAGTGGRSSRKASP
ncbi:MAG TPA: hypothetical protein VEL03_14845 [Streptosporangiaceae bacterium]|nr:hypothetical protein [Streptosporangiaceae bacterium]